MRGRGDSADLSSKARTGITQLARQLDSLGNQLRNSEAKGSINPRILAQRKQALKKLEVEAGRLRDKERAGPASSAKDALLAGASGKTYGGATAVRETELTRDLTTQEVMERSHQEMKQQDAVLDDMSKSLDRLQAIGGAIQDETKLHMKLLGDVEEQIDKGNVSLERVS
jgi:conjugal transfer/entry exclusion protein